jgi:ribosomal protein S18 acetylase RimI-like enzyme
VRPANPRDAALLRPLFESFYGDYLEARTVEAVRRNMKAAASVDTVLLATLGGRPAGFASLRLIPQLEAGTPHAELSDIYVADACRRRGVGAALVRFAEELAREKGSSRVVLTAGLNNDDARAFYRALGYNEFGVTLARPLEGSR